MKKKDLKTGMYVVFEKYPDEHRLVLLGTTVGDVTVNLKVSSDFTGKIPRLYDHYELSHLNDNLESSCIAGNVVRVYSTYGDLLWERKKEKPICTIDGVEYSESTLRSLIKKATE